MSGRGADKGLRARGRKVGVKPLDSLAEGPHWSLKIEESIVYFVRSLFEGEVTHYFITHTLPLFEI